MKKLLLLFFALLCLTGTVKAATPELSFDELYSGGGVLGLQFSDKVKGLSGQRVTIKGFMAPPLKAEAAFFVLTREPVALCPFCQSDADWPDNILVVYLSSNQSFVQNSRYEGTRIVAEPGKDTRYRVVLGVGVGALVLDQLTKLWVMASLPYYGAVTVIPGFFDLVNIRNRGAAFGFLNRSDIEWQFWLFFAATLVSAGVIFMLARSAQRGEKLLFWGLGMVLGGAVGNLVDRIRFRAVVDFLDFYVGQWHWPAFNVADIAICCGALLVCLSMWLKGPSGRAS